MQPQPLLAVWCLSECCRLRLICRYSSMRQVATMLDLLILVAGSLAPVSLYSLFVFSPYTESEIAPVSASKQHYRARHALDFLTYNCDVPTPYSVFYSPIACSGRGRHRGRSCRGRYRHHRALGGGHCPLPASARDSRYATRLSPAQFLSECKASRLI